MHSRYQPSNPSVEVLAAGLLSDDTIQQKEYRGSPTLLATVLPCTASWRLPPFWFFVVRRGSRNENVRACGRNDVGLEEAKI